MCYKKVLKRPQQRERVRPLSYERWSIDWVSDTRAIIEAWRQDYNTKHLVRSCMLLHRSLSSTGGR
jgi:hypothetical protein